jgi:hypothetical protein
MKAMLSPLVGESKPEDSSFSAAFGGYRVGRYPPIQIPRVLSLSSPCFDGI